MLLIDYVLVIITLVCSLVVPAGVIWIKRIYSKGIQPNIVVATIVGMFAVVDLSLVWYYFDRLNSL